MCRGYPYNVREAPATVSSIEEFIARLPKAELHVHLEGTVDPATLWKLAERHRTPLFQAGREALANLYSTGDFTAFLQAFKTVCEHIRTPEDYELITYNALRRLAEQNVRYAEVMVSAGVILRKQQNLRSCMEGIEAGYRQAREDFGIRAQWIFDAVRHFGADAVRAVAARAGRHARVTGGEAFPMRARRVLGGLIDALPGRERPHEGRVAMAACAYLNLHRTARDSPEARRG